MFVANRRRNSICAIAIALKVAIASLLFNSCTNRECDCYTNKDTVTHVLAKIPVKKTEGNSTHISKITQSSSVNLAYGFHLTQHNNQYYLSWLDTLKILHFAPLEPNSPPLVDSIFRTLQLSKYFSIQQINDTIHYVDLIKKKYIQLLIAPYTKGKCISSSYFGKKIPKNFLLYNNPGMPSLYFVNQTLFIPYQHQRKKYFIDNKAFIKINLGTNEIETTVDYPDCYHCNYVYEQGSFLAFDQEGKWYCLFRKYDKVLSETQNIKKRWHRLEHRCQFTKFDKSKEMNLSYIRKYLENEEENKRILMINNKYFVIIKRLFKKSLNDASDYLVFILDQDFRLLNQFKTDQGINPMAIFPYKNGFIIFSTDFKKYIYYEL